jgi:para-aminobenzoate synthetase component 2
LKSYFEELGASVDVISASVDEFIETINYDALIISPGPKRPEDAYLSRKILRENAGKIPILGVCLGHQIIGLEYGSNVVKGEKPMHGVVSSVTHNGRNLFKNIPAKTEFARYHSLVVSTCPEGFVVDATSDDGVIQAMSNEELALYSVQFHPESVASIDGKKLLKNFLEIANDFSKISR